MNVLTPAVLLAIFIIVSTILLIAAAVLGIDRGVLEKMGRTDFARGLITYLFAVATIGSTAVLTVSALTATGGADQELQERQFQQGKEILSLLLGIFGTIVGYYFGAETRLRASQPVAERLSVTPINLAPTIIKHGEKITVRAFVSGGRPPYRYGLAFSEGQASASQPVDDGGWIVAEVVPSQGDPNVAQAVHLVVRDELGLEVRQSATFKLI